METDDAPIFRYIYRSLKPKRHLEFGTWQGTGVLYCLEECEATVWTINLLEGESLPNGRWAYGGVASLLKKLPKWAKRKKAGRLKTHYQTDSFGFIGRHYRERRLGNRVCQIYCDSREWDISNYPKGFFDTVLVDGGHSEDVVISDTKKAFALLRTGGLIMWHDFCPDGEVYESCSSTKSVVDAISKNLQWIEAQLRDVFWIQPSWILLGIKK
jgi:predicted O-methyltransferase YrrM